MAQRKTILIIDDEADLRGELAEQIDLHDEFTAAQADSCPFGGGINRESVASRIVTTFSGSTRRL